VQLDVLAERTQRLRDLLRPDRRVEPVGAERDEQRAGTYRTQRLGETALAVLPRQIEIGERPRGVEVGVGVEALDEALALMAQVALDLELRLGTV
jgi:hypothetical protein